MMVGALHGGVSVGEVEAMHSNPNLNPNPDPNPNPNPNSQELVSN